MKNRIIGGIGQIIVGALVAVGPQTIFKICDQSHHSTPSTCFWTGQALIAVGIAFALLGVCYLFFSDTHLRTGLSLASCVTVVLVILITNVFPGMDEDSMMSCRVTTLPTLNFISIVSLALGAVNTGYLIRKKAVSYESEADGNARHDNTQIIR